jgi:hypothetical protein
VRLPSVGDRKRPDLSGARRGVRQEGDKMRYRTEDGREWHVGYLKRADGSYERVRHSQGGQVATSQSAVTGVPEWRASPELTSVCRTDARKTTAISRQGCNENCHINRGQRPREDPGHSLKILDSDGAEQPPR